MRFYRSGTFAGLALALLLFGSSAARAASITAGGFDQALGCSNVACGSSQTLEIGTVVAPVAGTIDLDTAALTLSFQLSVLQLPLVPIGSDDNGITALSFFNAVYNAVGLSVLDVGGSYTNPVDIAGTVPFVLQDFPSEGQLPYGKTHPVLNLMQHPGERALRLDDAGLRCLTVLARDEVVDVEARKAEAAEFERARAAKAAERAVREAEEAAKQHKSGESK